MHGHGYAPPQPTRPPTAVLVVLRIVFVALALLSVGFLAWAAMLRLAVVRRRRSDWVLFWLSLALTVTVFVVIGEFSTTGTAPVAEEDPTALDFVCVGVLFALAIGVPTHYLVAEIRHYQEPRPGWQPAGSPYGPPVAGARGPYGAQPPAPAYGYPPSAAPVVPAPGYGYPPVSAAPPVPPEPAGPVSPSAAAPSSTSPPAFRPVARPSAGRPAAPAGTGGGATPRIDQVRAELDELSDLLRKEEGK
ncbi:hypothetical protein [Streptomyces pristinaespiralis]|uniref:hypothetical protein n=1 Tax=Streptomyces pristinaespiralis TaxID=38300 RepID=UPI003837EDB6